MGVQIFLREQKMAALVGCPDTATDHASPDTDSLLAEFASLKMTIKSSKATVNNVKRVRQLKKILVHIKDINEVHLFP